MKNCVSEDSWAARKQAVSNGIIPTDTEELRIVLPTCRERSWSRSKNVEKKILLTETKYLYGDGRLIYYLNVSDLSRENYEHEVYI